MVVFNKIDLVDDPGKRARLEALYPEASFISAATGEGLEALQARLADFFDRALRPVRLFFPYEDGAARNRLRGIASDLREEHTAEGVIVEARLPAAEAARYARYEAARGAEGVDAPQDAQAASDGPPDDPAAAATDSDQRDRES
jgi:GTP-binding protein HflX